MPPLGFSPSANTITSRTSPGRSRPSVGLGHTLPHYLGQGAQGAACGEPLAHGPRRSRGYIGVGIVQEPRFPPPPGRAAVAARGRWPKQKPRGSARGFFGVSRVRDQYLAKTGPLPRPPHRTLKPTLTTSFVSLTSNGKKTGPPAKQACGPHTKLSVRLPKS